MAYTAASMDDAFTRNLRGVTPWGRQAFEYQAFFDLAAGSPPGRVLDCGAGPSSFTAEMSRQAWDVIAVDPLYRLDGPSIGTLVDDARGRMSAAMAMERDRFRWDFYGSPERLLTLRDGACRTFLEDYPQGRAAGRYVEGRLPALEFRDDTFALALCSHFLFLYSDDLDEAFHIRSLVELGRVAREIRVFPLIRMDGAPAQHVAPVCVALGRHGLNASIDPVPFEFQRGATRMLRITRADGTSKPTPTAHP
jgi:SAM-dependent methyltransferase